ncbi:MAG: hypothetical protein EXQ96_08780 [Alphaproteobacteria bacterium]|nr:hypothetical protein [Alphaproteobacteria bacterium]
MSDRAIRKAVADDPDTFIPDAAWWARAKVVQPPAKKAVSIRIDADVLAWFRAEGPGYQTRINAVLRSYAEAKRERRSSGRRSRVAPRG